MGLYELFGTADTTECERISGVVTGLVKENSDKEHPGMVKAEYFLGEKGKNLTGWIPVAVPYAGKGYGFYFLPEVGDIVLLAFEQGDINCPYIIGSVNGKINTLPEGIETDKNIIRKIRTKGGSEIIFNDEEGKERIEIHTPKNLHINMEDEKEVIAVYDESRENGIEIDVKNGNVKILAKKKIELSAGGNTMAEFDGNSKTVTFTGTKVNIKADQEVSIKGQNTQLGGSMVAIKGDSTAKVEAGGILQLKGSMTKIN